MSALASLKRNWIWAGLLLLCVLIAATAFIAPSRIGRMELRDDATVVAARISDAIKMQPQTLIGAFARPELAAHVSSIFHDLGYDHRVLRYQLYDDAGNLTFTSSKPGLQLDHEASEVPQGDDDPKVSIYNRSGTAVSHFAMLSIPIRMSGHLDGTLLVYLDQSERAKILSRYYGPVAAITMLLLGAGIATPIALAWTRRPAPRQAGMRCFEPGMDKALQRRRMIEHELRQALAREEFEVVYQSQHDLVSGARVGVEALVRWQHPVHGKVAPAHFISVAEETGLIVPLGEWVLRRACSDAVSWTEPLTVAVNLSPAQFRDADMAETVARVLRETGLPPKRLELEITESLLISDTDEVFGKLTRLRELGVRIVMDDFGTGYSSFNYLARFAFDKIKIDRQFVRNMTRDPAMLAIVKTIVTLGKSLGVTVTAEGVESEEQAAMLREFGCPEAQGFLYGQPGAPEATGTAKVTPIKRGTSAA